MSNQPGSSICLLADKKLDMNKNIKTTSGKTAPKDRAAEIANTFEWLITAFILAFIFRAFIMEAFRIPTGSMADTLMGDHFRLSCLQCGYRYNHGCDSRKSYMRGQSLPGGSVRMPVSRCPSCGYYDSAATATTIAKGDRILVLKCIYQFFEPKQWDVIVFKNPLDPKINYIKRLIARPGETLEIIDGDIYINGQISRKPPKVQKELWMPVYDNDYQPVRPAEPAFNRHTWQQPFQNTPDSNWQINSDNPTMFTLDSPPEKINSLLYDTSIGNDLRATYAYNSAYEYDYKPYCSDLMLRFYAVFQDPAGCIGIGLSKYQTNYTASVDSAGNMIIEADRGGQPTELTRKSIEPATINKPALVKFTNVDHQLIFQFGSEKLIYDLGRSPEDAGPAKPDMEPQVSIFGAGKLTLSHTAIFRDIHYTSKKHTNSSVSGRATQGNPLTLGEDEFFVLGDNSPNSEDSRWWNSPGRGNNNTSYGKGIVPRDYLVGKALYVYWPSGFRPFARFPVAIVPNLGQMRFIYGGSLK